MEQSKTRWGDRRLKPSTSIRDRPQRGEDQEVFRRESDGLSSPNPLQDDSTRDDAEAKNDFWSMTGDFIYRHHVEPGVKLYMPREESFRNSLKYIDVSRITHTSLNALLEKQIDDYWNVDGERELSDAGTGCTRFTLLNGRPFDGWEETYEKTHNLKIRHCMARCVEAYVWCSEKPSEAKMGYRETEAR